MPFGLCNATATFQRLMAHALIGVTKKYGNLVMCYVDDVVIATPTMEDHIEHRQSARYSRTQSNNWEDGGQAWHQTKPRCSGSGSDLEIAKDGTLFYELPGFRELLQGVHQGLRGHGIPDATTNETQRQEVHVKQRSGRVIPENKVRVVRGTGARDANRKRDVRAGHGCVGCRDFWHSP